MAAQYIPYSIAVCLAETKEFIIVVIIILK